MRALLQRVSEASVTVGDEVVGRIDNGLLVLLAVQPQDTAALAEKLVHKIVNYRIFADADGKMNQSVLDQGGGILWVSQFTLAADTRKGLRPSFTSAAEPGMALELFNHAVECSRRLGVINAQTGKFGADMKVALVNDGPVTIWLEL